MLKLKQLLICLIYIITLCLGIKIDLTPSSNSSIFIYLNLNEDFQATILEKNQSSLWNHTQALIKMPFSVQELKTCLVKTFIYEKNAEALQQLGFYSIFSYPDEIKPIPKQFINKSTFCQDYNVNITLEQQNEYNEFLIQYQLSDMSRNLTRAILLLHQAEQLGSKDAPVYLYFLLQMQLVLNKPDFAIEDLTIKQSQLIQKQLIEEAIIRGSDLASAILFTDIRRCQALENEQLDLFDEFQNLIIYKQKANKKQQQGSYDIPSTSQNQFSQETTQETNNSSSKSKEDEEAFNKEEEQFQNDITEVLNAIETIIGLNQDGYCKECSNAVNQGLLTAISTMQYINDNGGESQPVNSLYDEDNDQFISASTSTTQSTPSSSTVKSNSNNEYFQEILIQNAENGDVNSMLTLGELYTFGNAEYGFPQHPEQAFHYYNQAAQAGNGNANYNVGLMYAQGLGVQQDGEQAMEHFKIAVQKNQPEGYNGLAFLSSQGIGVKQNLTKAAQYFEKSSQLGYIEATTNLANLYITGFDNTEKNITKAVNLLKKISEKNAHAKFTLVYLNTYYPEANISCQKQMEYLESVLSKGQYNLFMSNGYEKFKKKDFFGALLYYSFASLLGVEGSHEDVALLWEKSNDHNIRCKLNDNLICAMIYYHRALLAGSERSSLKLGNIFYYGGKHFLSEYQFAFYYYSKSLENNPESMYSISYLYQNGLGVQKDLKKALELNRLILQKSFNNTFDSQHFWPSVINYGYLKVKQIIEDYLI